MLTDIRSVLMKNKTNVEETVYTELPEKIAEYPLTIGDFNTVISGQETVEQFSALLDSKKQFFAKLGAMTEYTKCEEQIKELSKVLKTKRVSGEILDWEERTKLKQEKKRLGKRKEEIVQNLEKEMLEEYGFDFQTRKAILYKKTVYFSWFDDLQKMFPALEWIRTEDIRQIPLFVSHLEKLREAVRREEPIGFVGGPCLFGIDEMLIEFETKDGHNEIFDCSCGRRCLAQSKIWGEESIEDYLAKHGGQVCSFRLLNRKNGVTRQEYDSIRYLFAVAEVFHGKVVIPLPDMSYFKYMEKSLWYLSEFMIKRIMNEFCRECYTITDKYIRMIERIAQEFPKIEYTVVHHRNRELCRLFEQYREKYIRESAYMRKITSKDQKKEAVVDYITMLALPYYIYGTSYVVQVDSVDETDSGRKCNKIHGKDMELIQILYPEYLSSDGKHTIYNTSLEYKDYLEMEERIEKI